MEAAPPPVDLGPPLLESDAADESRQKLEALASVAATAPPPPQYNPLEEMIREMLRPILKQWLDEHLPAIVDEHGSTTPATFSSLKLLKRRKSRLGRALS